MYSRKLRQLNTLVFQVEEIEIVMPNQHYFTIDMTKMGLSNKDEVSCYNLSFKVFNREIIWLLTSFFPLTGSSTPR